jgi:hypothetical protein
LANDSIGKGPSYNFKGEMIAQDLAHLHGYTMELAHQENWKQKLLRFRYLVLAIQIPQFSPCASAQL